MTAFLYQRSLGDSLPNPTLPCFRAIPADPTSDGWPTHPRSSLAIISRVASVDRTAYTGSMTGSLISTAVTLSRRAGHLGPLSRHHRPKWAVRGPRPPPPSSPRRPLGLDERRSPGATDRGRAPARLPCCFGSRQPVVAQPGAGATGAAHGQAGGA